jgi:uncharacterized membrane protein YgcG
VFFILLNILLAILVDAYVAVKEDSQKRQAQTIGADISDIISDMYCAFLEGKKFGIPKDAHMKKLIYSLSNHDKHETALRHAMEYTRLTLKHPKDRTIEISFPTLCQYLKQECTLNNDQATKLGLAIMTRYGDESRVTTEEELEEDRDELADEAEAAAERRQYTELDRELPAVDELPLLSPAVPPNVAMAPTPKQSQNTLTYNPKKGPPSGLFSQCTGRGGGSSSSSSSSSEPGRGGGSSSGSSSSSSSETGGGGGGGTHHTQHIHHTHHTLTGRRGSVGMRHRKAL